jgi:hypothetical protein
MVELTAALLGPLGALAAALLAVYVLWRRCERLETELRSEREARLGELRNMADRLLRTWTKVDDAIDVLERVTHVDLPGPSLPPDRSR